jgi:hypothetical protein
MPRNLLREGHGGAQALRDRPGVDQTQGRYDDAVCLRHDRNGNQSLQDRQDTGSESDGEEAVARRHQGKGGLPAGARDKQGAGSEGVRHKVEAVVEPIVREECASCKAWHIEYGCLIWWQFHERGGEESCEFHDAG